MYACDLDPWMLADHDGLLSLACMQRELMHSTRRKPHLRDFKRYIWKCSAVEVSFIRVRPLVV